MPTYTFRHKESGEVVEKVMRMSERDAWVEANSDYEQVHDSINIGDSVRMGITKPPSDFQKHIIGKVAKMPGAKINSKFGIPKEW
jgi:hypothetical protein